MKGHEKSPAFVEQKINLIRILVTELEQSQEAADLKLIEQFADILR